MDSVIRAAIPGKFALFTRVILPLSGPVLGALVILDFVATGNEFWMALANLQSKAS